MATKKPKSGSDDDKAVDGTRRDIVIKKYPNRRLYNTATSSYIVLKDVVELVRQGREFRIEDAKSGEDITRSILNQIIFEQETGDEAFHFPLEFQKQLIGMYGDGYASVLPNFLTESMKMFAKERMRMSGQVEDAVSRNAKAMIDYTQALAKQNMELFQKGWNMFSMVPGMQQSFPSGSESAQADGGEGQSREEELAEIQAKIEALEARLKALK